MLRESASMGSLPKPGISYQPNPPVRHVFQSKQGNKRETLPKLQAFERQYLINEKKMKLKTELVQIQNRIERTLQHYESHIQAPMPTKTELALASVENMINVNVMKQVCLLDCKF